MNLHPTTAFASLALALLTAAAGAAESMWTNPAGGLWSDPANWSSGVPGAADHAVFPSLDRDGYTVTLGGAIRCASCTATGSGVVLSAGSLQTSAEFEVGTDGHSADVTLEACVVSAPVVRVGTNRGDGKLFVDAYSTIGGGTFILAGTDPSAGTAQCVFESGGHGGFVQLGLGAGAILIIEATPGQPAAVVAFAATLAGTLVITLDATWSAPSQAAGLLLSSTPLTGAFSSVVLPELNGVPLSYSASAASIALNPFDPLVDLSLSIAPAPLYIGFEQSLVAVGTRLSGAIVNVTDQCDFDVSAGEDHVALVAPDELIAFGDQPFTLHGIVNFQGQLIAADLSLTALSPAPNAMVRVDLNEAGDTPNNSAWFTWLGGQPTMSADGRLVAFSSYATNLVTPAPSLKQHVYVKDRWTGAVERVDMGEVSGIGDMAAFDPAMSSDGRYVAFKRRVPGSTLDSIWVRDRWSQETWLVSAGLAGELNNGTCSDVCIAGNGSVVFFSSAASNLLPDVAPTSAQIFRYDLSSRALSLVSRNATGAPANGQCRRPMSSADGRVVVFESLASNLLPCTGGIVLWDEDLNALEAVAVGPSGCASIPGSLPSISADGKRIAFGTSATNLGGTSAPGPKTYVRDRLAGTTTWVDLSSVPLSEPLEYFGPVLSGDGKSMVIRCESTWWRHLVRVKLETMEASLVVFDPWQNEVPLETGYAADGRPWLSHDGSLLSFAWIGEGVVPFTLPADLAVMVHRFGGFLAADLNRDGFVNAADLAELLVAWGMEGSSADLDGDGVVGAGDLAALLAAWSV